MSTTDTPGGLTRTAMGLCLFLLPMAFIALLIHLWPGAEGCKSDESASTAVAAAKLIFGYCFDVERQLFAIAAVSGGMGALIHTASSFGDFIGNRSLRKSWVWWYVLRIPIGMSLALLFYMLIRSGLMGGAGSSSDAAALINPHAVAAISALAGMFSKQAADKLGEVFATLFKSDKDKDRKDPLLPGPMTFTVMPTVVPVGASPLPSVVVTGSDFTQNTKAFVGNDERPVQIISATQVRVELNDADVVSEGTITVRLITQSEPSPTWGDVTITVQKNA